jgi:AcrR family transcriptional regulator
MEMDEQPASGRAQRRDAVAARMVDAAIAIMVAGEELNHDRVAAAADVARRTAYRYFPDREALMQAVWSRITELAGPQVAFPRTEAELVESLPAIHQGFDQIAEIATLLRATPQGRAIRLSKRAERIAAYRAAAADAVAALPEVDATMASAILQVLHTTPWLEMRDQWGFDGARTARALAWAMRVLLADLRGREGRPLDEGPA